MSLAVFYVSALIWAFICALAAIVAGAAVGSRMSPVKRALVGVGVGAVFGIASVYLADLLRPASDLFELLLPAQFVRLVPSVSRALLMIGAATLTATAVGTLSTRSGFAIRGYAIVGAAFGLLVGIAHTMLLLIARYVVFPAMEAAGLYSLSPAFLFAAMMAIGVIVDITLAVVAFRLFRGRRVAAFADDAARTC
jgi:hypothetical protein